MYQIILRGKVKVSITKAKMEYDEEKDTTSVTVDAKTRAEAYRVGARLGDIISVTKQ